MLVTGFIGKLLQARLDVVLGDFLSATDGFEVYDTLRFFGGLDVFG